MKNIILFCSLIVILAMHKPNQLVENLTIEINDKTYVLKPENFFAKSTFENITKIYIKEFDPEKYDLEVIWKINKPDKQVIQPKDNEQLSMFAPKFVKPKPNDWIMFTLVEKKSEQPRTFKITFKD